MDSPGRTQQAGVREAQRGGSSCAGTLQHTKATHHLRSLDRQPCAGIRRRALCRHSAPTPAALHRSAWGGPQPMWLGLKMGPQALQQGSVCVRVHTRTTAGQGASCMHRMFKGPPCARWLLLISTPLEVDMEWYKQKRCPKEFALGSWGGGEREAVV